MNRSDMVALNNEHIRELRSMAREHVQSNPARAERGGAVRDAAGWFLVRLGRRIAVHLPLSPASR
jgi:hypothetical protein